MRPHRRQPTRLPRPWDSPGKNTGVGCHFLLQCKKVKSESEVAQSCPTPATPWTAAYQAPLPMGFSRQEYWSGVPLPSPIMEARREQKNIFKLCEKKKPCQPYFLFPVKISFNNEGKIKTFSTKRRTKECVTIRPPLQEVEINKNKIYIMKTPNFWKLKNTLLNNPG